MRKLKVIGKKTKNMPRADRMEELDEFINKNGIVQTYRFFVYGEPNTEEVDMLIRGLLFQFLEASKDYLTMVVAEKVDEDSAVLFNKYRGVVLTFAFATKDKPEELVENVILDGLEYLRFKAEYLGTKERVSNV